MTEARPALDPYRIGFILNTTVGNMTRYQNLHKYAQRVDGVECHWAPINHYIQRADRPAWARRLPNAVYVRASVIQQFWPVWQQYGRLDAVLIHLFEADLLTTLGRKRWPNLLRVSNTDDAPIVNPGSYPLYASQIEKPEWRKRVRLAIDLWRARHTDFFVPNSEWIGGLLVNDCGIEPSRVRPLHVGVDLETWAYRPKLPTDSRPRLLFVGGEFERKGGFLLLDVFAREFAGQAELHLVTKQAPASLPPHVVVHANLNPNDGSLARLYESADIVIVPTKADTGPLWVFLEAMAIGRPVIGTLTGANAEVVIDGETGMAMPIGDGAALASAIRKLLNDPPLRLAMGERGRRLVEERFNSSLNVPRMFDVIKAQIDLRRRLKTAA